MISCIIVDAPKKSKYPVHIYPEHGPFMFDPRKPIHLNDGIALIPRGHSGVYSIHVRAQLEIPETVVEYTIRSRSATKIVTITNEHEVAVVVSF